MIRSPAFATVMLLGAACRHGGVVAPDAPSPTEAAVSATVAPAPPADNASPRRVLAEGESFRVRSWSFDTRRASFTIEDLDMKRPLLEALGSDAVLAVNGGFFDVDGRALGLAVSQGKALARFSETMSGGVFSVTNGIARVEATEDFNAKSVVEFAIQCRPRLVVDGKPNVKKNDGRGADRTALCVRDAGRGVDVVLAEHLEGNAGPSLFALGHYLAEERHCDDALNLDGGPSTGAAYRTAARGNPVVVAPRGPLRHAVVIREIDAPRDAASH